MSLLLPVDHDVTLRLVAPSHAEEIAAAVTSSHAHIARWMPWAKEGYNADDAREWITCSLKEFGERKSLPLSILEHGKVVGGTGWTFWEQVNRTEWELTANTADIGYWLVESAQGRGIMTRCVQALLDYGFGEAELHRITIRAEPDNARSRAVPERLGFQYEGTQRHVFKWKDRWVDHRYYAMLADEWPAVKERLDGAAH